MFSIDGLIDSARRELNRNRQIELWKEAQYKILQLAASYPIMGLGYANARRSSIDWGYGMISFTDGPKANEKTRLLSNYLR